MPFRESPGIQDRANILASDALSAQLNILQFFLPLQGWAVAGRAGDHFVGIAANGHLHALGCADFNALIRGSWLPDLYDERLHYRMATPAELELISSLDPEAGQGVSLCLMKVELRTAEAPSTGALLGMAPVLPGKEWAAHADEICLCLQAMALTLALHGELTVAEQLMLEMQRDAFIDPLTSTLNRAGWINRLAHIDATLSGGDAAIVMLDLDFLKQVNDTQGHSAGDDLLRLTAQTISSVLRSSDAVGRLGGDEFGVVVQNATPETAHALSMRLQRALDDVDVKISMGMALKSEAGTLKKTLQLADERMYEHKRTKPAPRRFQAPPPSRRMDLGAADG
jgi:diguanylate cyclase (GGDEF)-like protein